MRILLVCSGNICRSPMAAAFLRRDLDAASVVADVRSVGFAKADLPSPPETVEAMHRHGIDLTGHRSHRITVPAVDGADLVLAMTARHVRETVVLHPPARDRVWGLGELVRLAEANGGRLGAPLGEWLGDLAAHRGVPASTDDVEDPHGRPARVHRKVADQIEDLTSRLVAVVWDPVT